MAERNRRAKPPSASAKCTFIIQFCPHRVSNTLLHGGRKNQSRASCARSLWAEYKYKLIVKSITAKLAACHMGLCEYWCCFWMGCAVRRAHQVRLTQITQIHIQWARSSAVQWAYILAGLYSPRIHSWIISSTVFVASYLLFTKSTCKCEWNKE